MEKEVDRELDCAVGIGFVVNWISVTYLVGVLEVDLIIVFFLAVVNEGRF